MRISELAARSGVPIGTIKYYLREGLLPPGRQTSRTTAEYEDAHLERLRLVRALTDAGGLGIAAVRRVVAVIDAPAPSRLDVLAVAQDALLAEGPREEASPRTRSWAVSRGWTIGPDDPLLQRLDHAWEACEQAGIPVDAELMDRYADAMAQVALADVDSVPAEADGAVRRVVIGTVMMEPVLLALRMMAQREQSIRRAGQVSQPDGDPA